jgi:hypothetical protein
MKAHSAGTSTAAVTVTAIRGHTGRSAVVDDGYRLAEKWSKARLLGRLRRHAGARRLREAMGRMSVTAGEPLICYRGSDRQYSVVSSWEDVGPPPAELAGDQRYSRVKVPAWYLADSIDGVMRELQDRGRPLTIQCFALDRTLLRLVDLNAHDVATYVQAVFDVAESACIDGRGGPNDFKFSQTVAETVTESGFDGMIVPGVRGDAALHYRNVVLLRAHRWLAGATPVGGLIRRSP